MAKRQYIVGIGELFWEHLAGGRRLCGSPATFAYHISCQGWKGVAAAAVGNDEAGADAIAEMKRLGIDTSYIQQTAAATGVMTTETVEEEVKQNLSAPAAWDFLAWNDSLAQLAEETHAVAFGTLSQRSAVTRDTIRNFITSLPAKCPKILDLNLYPGNIDKNLIVESLGMANILKLNEQEMNICRKMLTLTGAPAEGAYTMIERYQLAAVIITKGAKGMSYYDKEICFDLTNPAKDMAVEDTSGCGDAFLAAFLAARIFGHAPQPAAEHAQLVASYVAACPEAMPELPEELKVKGNA